MCEFVQCVGCSSLRSVNGMLTVNLLLRFATHVSCFCVYHNAACLSLNSPWDPLWLKFVACVTLLSFVAPF